MHLPLDGFSPLNTNLSKAFMIGSQCESVGVNRNILNCTLPDGRNIQQNNSRIGTLGVNEDIFSPSCNLTKTSSLRSCTWIIKPLDTSIHGSATQERNSDLLCIEKYGVKIVLGEIVPDLDPIKWANPCEVRPQRDPKFQKPRAPCC